MLPMMKPVFAGRFGICVIDDIKDLDGDYIIHFMTGHGAEHSIAARLSAEARGISVGATFHKPFKTARMIEKIESDAERLFGPQPEKDDASPNQVRLSNACSSIGTA